jgi:hypothetical protein
MYRFKKSELYSIEYVSKSLLNGPSTHSNNDHRIFTVWRFKVALGGQHDRSLHDIPLLSDRSAQIEASPNSRLLDREIIGKDML